jgi:hypothetical protein
LVPSFQSLLTSTSKAIRGVRKRSIGYCLLSSLERIKEKKLLRALGRRGKLTAVEAALETSLSVEEANQMLFELALQGQLEVTVEHGRLLYSFWGERDAP